MTACKLPREMQAESLRVAAPPSCADSPGDLNGFVEGIGLHVEQPLYAGGRYTNAARASAAQVSAAMAGLQVIVDNVSLQVCLAYQAMDADSQRIELARTGMAQARENLRLTEVRYQNGTATPTDVVDAQTALSTDPDQLLHGRIWLFGRSGPAGVCNGGRSAAVADANRAGAVRLQSSLENRASESGRKWRYLACAAAR